MRRAIRDDLPPYGEFFGTGVLFGVVDPSVGDGIEAPPGMIYGRNNNGRGELWLKVGVGDTDWDELETRGKPNI